MSMGEIHKLSVVKPEPFTPVVTALEKLLARAHNGEYYAMAVTLLRPNGDIDSMIVGDAPDTDQGNPVKLGTQLIGALDILKDDVKTLIADRSEHVHVPAG